MLTNNLKGLKNLKLVIFCIDPDILFLNDNANLEKWREKFYYHFWNIEPEDHKPTLFWHFKTVIYDPKTILSYAMHGFYNVPKPFIEDIDSLGWERGYFTFTKDILNYKTGKEIANVHSKSLDLSSTKNSKYIINLNNILKTRDIKLMLIQLPRSKYYLKYVPDEILNKNEKLIDSLSLNEGIPYYNFRKDSLFDDCDYRDVNHLNFVGAKKFSIMLSEIIDDNIK